MPLLIRGLPPRLQPIVATSKRTPFSTRHLLAVFVIASFLLPASSQSAGTYTWTPTAQGTYDWNAASSNWITGFPNAPDDIANLNNDIQGNQTIRLQEDITLGTLNIGDPAGAPLNTFHITNATGEAFNLIFNSSSFFPAQINTTGVGTITNTITAPITLNSDLAVNIGGSNVLTFNGTITTNNHNITFTGGANFVTGANFAGDLTGNGVITNNSNMSVSFGGGSPKSFTGILVANKGIGSSNSGSFTLTNGSAANASEFIINGYLIGNSQQGGSIHSGNNSPMDTNPGQRLTTGTITLNGGTLRAVGQAAEPLSPWQIDQELVVDNVSKLNFNSGYSLVGMNVGANSAGTVLNVATLQRGAGASGFVSSSVLGTGAKLFVGNSASLLIGADGANGPTSLSIIPWLGAANTNGSASAPDGFATYTANGVRALVVATEYATSITAGSTANVNTNALTIPGPTTVNSLRFTTGASNITNNSTNGVGQILTVASGGVFFTSNSGTIGQTGSVRAGTLNFGAAEGVVWANSSNVNTIGAVVTGSAGLTKAGSGTLILSGANTYTGTTHISGGTLQVGIGGVGQSGEGEMVLNARGTTLAGTGTVRGNTTLTFGTIKPGDSAGAEAGKLTIEGDLSFTPEAPDIGSVTTVAEFKILNSANSDLLVVNGDFTLNEDSRLVVTLDGAYSPAAGDSWTLLDWSGLVTLGGFATGDNLRDGSTDDGTNLDLPTLAGGIVWDISELADGGALTISVVAVPEPARALLLVVGLALVGLRRRRS